MYVQLLKMCIFKADSLFPTVYKPNREVGITLLIVPFYYITIFFLHAQGSHKGLQYKTELPKEQMYSLPVSGLQKFHSESLQMCSENVCLLTANLFSSLCFMDLLTKCTKEPKMTDHHF